MTEFAQEFLYSTELENLSDEFMEDAKTTQQFINNLKSKREAEIAEMVVKITAIVTRLELEGQEGIPDKTDLTKSNLDECKEQLVRLEELKKASLGKMIAKTQEEIAELELMVYASDLEKLKFERQVLGKVGHCKEEKLNALERRADQLRQKYRRDFRMKV